mmetsp:Transcript_13615/g.22218  ORF Transcript_13615/g.22218 Transcript_13615/m.22218 type:complete len:355 (+) Transcript_13615:172-1236(+)|eukprot:CAMPEP_0203765812 /NCGR_PEP_ID=MMETSP0099_2-20121227/71_1 /ASSEMBLY_ACC=CAM_ASM_000209 /TAXON_ID=96639 /ORGANISM=" , Strain NY0313808BC1" /LENGTH=354 /DNA_ID=CAMNT_0050662095 /DNA_START=113 /DNA_END=1177 /DNA_ORIENTATION=-
MSHGRRVVGWGVRSMGGPVEAVDIERRAVHAHDVEIAISYAGVCHSDIHAVSGDWGDKKCPLVPGHEIVGTVTKVGELVQRFKVGDIAGVGTFVDSCRTCGNCVDGNENFCDNGLVLTYGGICKYDHCAEKGAYTQGGYSKMIVVDEKYTQNIPDGLDLKGVAPLLCAGITSYSPLKRQGVGKGTKLAIVGLGGLGHMGVKFGVAMGAEVTVISRGPKKRKAASDLGAVSFVDSTDPDALAAAKSSFDVILDTVAASHDIDTYLQLLRLDGVLVLVGLGSELKFTPRNIIVPRKSIVGSLTGGVAETQEMLQFCAKYGIVSDVEVIEPEYINTAFERTNKSDVLYRFVIDVSKM